MDERYFLQVLKRLDGIVWGPVLLCLLLGTGIYLMIRLRFLPLRKLKFALLCAVGMEGKGTRPAKKGDISPFAALMTELATTIGTGNIVGVATAMVLGGPGALLWMAVSALVGMATKLVESELSVKYRVRNGAGEYAGGPMYTMARRIRPVRFGKFLAFFFSFFAVTAAFGMGNMTQANSISAAFRTSFGISPEKTGLILTILTILVVLGGIRGISKISTILVPFMGIFYILGTLTVILRNLPNVPEGICRIVGMAFCPRAFGGGLLGGITVTVMDSLRFGVARGVFSNEAGVGASGISAATAGTDDYIKQGFVSMTGVFVDTVVICMLTGLAIASSGLLGTADDAGNQVTGIDLVTMVFEEALGKWGGILIAVSIALFAFATIVGWAYQGEKAFEYLAGSGKFNLWFRFFYALSSFVGAVLSLDAVWTIADICNGLMAFPNLICVLMLSGEAVREIREYCGELHR